MLIFLMLNSNSNALMRDTINRTFPGLPGCHYVLLGEGWCRLSYEKEALVAWNEESFSFSYERLRFERET